MKELLNLNRKISKNDRKYPSTASIKSIGFNKIDHRTFTFLVDMMSKEELLHIKEELRMEIKKGLSIKGTYSAAKINERPPQIILCLEYVNQLIKEIHD